MNAVQSRPDMIERVMLEGDLQNMSPQERVNYYSQVCESMHLNPLTKPFDYLRLNGKLVLYANKNCAEQIRRNLKISLTLPEKRVEHGVYIVTARAEVDGRIDEATGAINIEGLKGESLANAIMKCETKAKRRVTLSYAGLGMLDETEVESIPGAQKLTEKDITPNIDKKSAIQTAQEKFEAERGITKTESTKEKIPDEIMAIAGHAFTESELSMSVANSDGSNDKILYNLSSVFYEREKKASTLQPIFSGRNYDVAKIKACIVQHSFDLNRIRESFAMPTINDVATEDKMPTGDDAAF